MSDEPEVEGLAEVDPRATRNAPVNINIATGTAANTSGSTNVAPPGGSGAGATGSAQGGAGGSATWESGAGQATPTLASVSPTGAVAGAGDFSLTATGTNYNTTTVLSFNGVMLDTTYISATQVRVTVPNATGQQTAGAKPVVAYNGPVATSAVNCTLT